MKLALFSARISCRRNAPIAIKVCGLVDLCQFFSRLFTAAAARSAPLPAQEKHDRRERDRRECGNDGDQRERALI